MAENNYKLENLKVLKEYSDEYYNSYKDQFKTANGYIIGISSSAIFAFFVLLQKMTTLSSIVVLGIKVCIFLFFISLVILLITNILSSKKSLELHKLYYNGYKETRKKKHNDEIFEVLNNIDSINIKEHYIEIGKAINYAYLCFGLAITIITSMIIFKG